MLDRSSPTTDLEAAMAALLASAGPRTVPTLDQAQRWLWTGADARERRDRAAAAERHDDAIAFGALAMALDHSTALSRLAQLAGEA